MYLGFFGLSEKPFAITPDPRYLYLSARHADALAHLVYGISEAGGFIQLTGEVGTGKTTIIRSLLARAPGNAEIALIINPRMSPTEFLLTICEELGLGLPDSAEGNNKELVDALNRYLLRSHAEGRRVVLIVDEAQNLEPQVLEQVRLLTNLETASQKLLQIILIGQPELRELLARNDLRQLAQRITARYHLDPLSAEETSGYVRHRMRVAGATSEVFSPAALREVYRVSGGVPRVINVVCDRALLGAYTQDEHEVSPRLLRNAGAEVFGHRLAPRWLAPLLAGLALLLAGGGWALWRLAPWSTTPPTPPVAVQPAPTPPPAAPPTLAELLTRAGPATGTDAAFAQLLKLWNAGYVVGNTDGCTQAAAAGLECITLRSSLAQLRELNRPAILMLRDQSGTSYEVVLSALEEERARLQLGETSATVGIAELTRFWFGDLVLLWRPATATVNSLSLGTRGPAVRQLRARLLQWRGRDSGGTISNVYDNELAKLVEDFQRAHHLAIDGVAGIETQLLLDSLLAQPGSPLLHAPDADPGTAGKG